jgi:hypothetical protein
MTTLTPLVLSAALLVASPGFSEGGRVDLTQPEAFAIVANVLGAAVACDRIAHNHVSAMARQVGALATARAISVEEVATIDRLLMVSAAAGWHAVEDGEADCKTVEAAFREIEQAVLQTAV